LNQLQPSKKRQRLKNLLKLKSQLRRLKNQFKKPQSRKLLK